MITYALIIVNIIIFIITAIFSDQIIGSLDIFQNQIIFEYAGLGFRPLYLDLSFLPQSYTLFTSMFIHGGFAHIFGNMIILFFIGIPFEQRVGWKKFIIIYLIAGICGSLTHSILNLEFPNNYITLIGASGAIFGIMGAFAVSYPRDEVVMPIGIGIMFLTRIKVMYAVIFFAAVETFIVWLDVADTTAHYAHLGGLIAGAILAAVLIRRNKKADGTVASFETTYYDSYTPQKPDKKDYSNLEKLATTNELKDILKKIENETVPQVRDTWIEHFVEKAVCPKCGNKLFNLNHKISCEKCGFKTNY
jgi:membrane associated rhomboid family serine protease